MILKSTERGQALILIALAIVGIIALTALAIDGGMAFSDRRHAQNAADTASLAAALEKVYNRDWNTAAFSRAASNGYTNDGVRSTVIVNNPPGAGCNGIPGPYAGNSEYIQVIVRSNVDTFFAPVIGVDQVHNCVDAIARAKPAYTDEMFFGNATVSLSPTACSSYWVHGTGDVNLNGGGVFVNSNCCGSNPAFNAFRESGSGTITAPSISVVGCASYSAGDVSPIPETGVNPIPYLSEYIVWPDPPCSGPAVQSGNTLSPGSWSGTFPPSGVTMLESGIYCVNGDFKVGVGATLTGQDVLIVMNSGGITWNGGATINLDAPNEGMFAGLLIYAPLTNNSPIVINGNSDSHVSGTILAPAASITINGTGATGGFGAQVIGYNVEFAGTSNTYIYYQDEQNYDATYPPSIELTE